MWDTQVFFSSLHTAWLLFSGSPTLWHKGKNNGRTIEEPGWTLEELQISSSKPQGKELESVSFPLLQKKTKWTLWVSMNTCHWPSAFTGCYKIKECPGFQQSGQQTVNRRGYVFYTFKLGTLNLHAYSTATSSIYVLDPNKLFCRSNEINKGTIVKDHRIPIKSVKKCLWGNSKPVNGNDKPLLTIPGLLVKYTLIWVNRVNRSFFHYGGKARRMLKRLTRQNQKTEVWLPLATH